LSIRGSPSATPPRALEGTRNSRLNEAAFKAGLLIGDRRLTEPDAFEMLLNAAHECGLAEREATRTITSGMSAGIERARVEAQ
jgi:hypothetical protein